MAFEVEVVEVVVDNAGAGAVEVVMKIAVEVAMPSFFLTNYKLRQKCLLINPFTAAYTRVIKQHVFKKRSSLRLEPGSPKLPELYPTTELQWSITNTR